MIFLLLARPCSMLHVNIKNFEIFYWTISPNTHFLENSFPRVTFPRVTFPRINPVNTPIILLFSVFKSMFSFWLTQSIAFGPRGNGPRGNSPRINGLRGNGPRGNGPRVIYFHFPADHFLADHLTADHFPVLDFPADQWKKCRWVQFLSWNSVFESKLNLSALLALNLLLKTNIVVYWLYQKFPILFFTLEHLFCQSPLWIQFKPNKTLFFKPALRALIVGTWYFDKISIENFLAFKLQMNN
jgi:hypothetical protein